MRTGLWDRQGANIGNRYKEMYGVELFVRLRPVSLDLSLIHISEPTRPY